MSIASLLVEVYVARRPDGALEHEIMAVLWQSEQPLNPGEVQQRIESDLAYTSVATVLGRLEAKGLVERTAKAGRAFAYRARLRESELAAHRISEMLSGASDRGQVLAGFVSSLSKKEAEALRILLDQGDP